MDTTHESTVDEVRKVAVITGASSGIGHASAVEFARQGYDVVLAARRTDALKTVAEACRKEGASVMVVTTDTTDEKAVMLLAARAIEKYGHFDVWVNGAAVGLYAKFEDTPSDAFRQVMETDFFGYVYGSRAALNHFREREAGVLINISSVVAAAPQPYNTAYTAAKYAVRGFSESLRMELNLDGLNDIHVCTAMPATVDTPFFQNAANYTGRGVQAMNPVYDAQYVAKNIVSLAEKPKREMIIGPAGKVMALQHTLMSGSYEKLQAKITDRDHLSDEPSLLTPGSLFEPTSVSSSIDGGWREERMPADKLNIMLGTGLAIAATAGLVTWKLLRPSRT